MNGDAKRLVITRQEMTTYSVVVELPEEEARGLLEQPVLHTSTLLDLCRANADRADGADDSVSEFEIPNSQFLPLEPVEELPRELGGEFAEGMVRRGPERAVPRRMTPEAVMSVMAAFQRVRW